MMREHDRYEQRLDAQDSMLREILSRMAEHKMEHELVDPSINELVTILKSIKFLRGLVIVGASIIAGCWALIVWARDHIKL